MVFKKYKVVGLFAVVFILSCSDVKVHEKMSSSVESYIHKELQVYTTAKDTDLRLSKTGEQKFTRKVQPLETDIAVFVNPKKTFQTYLGIGGAITDASSEVFAALGDEQQNTVLKSRITLP